MRERERHEVREKREEAARWKPNVAIKSELDGIQYVNKLVLKSNDSFRLIEVSLLAPSGAKLFDYPLHDSWVDSKGFSFPISLASLNNLSERDPSVFDARDI
jgi:hypothetical protein